MEGNDVERDVDLGRWTTDPEVRCLYLMASSDKPEAIVEIGSWKGRSTVHLAYGARESKTGKKVYAVDPHVWGTEQILKENIKKAKVDDIVIPIVKKSEDAARDWQGAISLLFIDGAHDYESARQDFVLWEPWVVPGGFIAIHDKFYEGPARMIREYVLKSDRFSKVGVAQGLLYTTKGADITLRDRINKLYLLMLTYAITAVVFLTRPRWLHWVKNILVKIRCPHAGRWLSHKL